MLQGDLQSKITIGKTIQQEFYELSSDWDVYGKKELVYLKKQIAFTLKGEAAFLQKEYKDVAPIVDQMEFDAQTDDLVQRLFTAICDNGTLCENNNIYCSVIYNVLIFAGTSNQSKEKNTANNINDHIYSQPVPIFKVKKILDKQSETIWYIDTSGRVYTSWRNYINNNNLPKCLMVLPKDGFYQADTSCLLTEDQSTVLIEALFSPACTTKNVVAKAIDITSAVGTTLSAGVGIAACFTPIGPAVLMTSVAIAGASSLWNIGRASNHLNDRSKHKQSLKDREAIGSWLTIAGNVTSVAATGSVIALGQLVNRGVQINKTGKTIFNVVQGLNLASNGTSNTIQVLDLFKKFKQNEEVTVEDIALIALKLMHFGMSIITVQFANNIIKNCESSVLSKYEQSLRSERHRREFDKLNLSKFNINKQIIRSAKTVDRSLDLYKHNYNYISKTNNFKDDKIIFDGTALINPTMLIKATIQVINKFATGPVNSKIRSILRNKISNFLLKFDIVIVDYTDYEEIIAEIQRLNQPKNIITLLLQISTDLITNDITTKDLALAIKFVLGYCKSVLQHNLRERLNPREENEIMNEHLSKILITVVRNMDKLLDNFSIAFAEFLIEFRKNMINQCLTSTILN
ncbi:uncharacterized protein [Prorops nasuta]|uniref:uncharacterized protein n=1 Tax=Prorops nasuta TaxID=863751 RepID=UPI0034CDF7E8